MPPRNTPSMHFTSPAEARLHREQVAHDNPEIIAARVRAEAKGRIDHAAEGQRLRQEQRKAAIRERVAARSAK